MKSDILHLIDLYLKHDDYTLTDFQLECLDYIDEVLSSICYGENDVELSMEIWKENDFYMEIDNKGNILKEW